MIGSRMETQNAADMELAAAEHLLWLCGCAGAKSELQSLFALSDCKSV